MTKLSAAVAKWFRRESDPEPPRFVPVPLRDGLPWDVPAAVYRKLEQCREAMRAGDARRIRMLQESLLKGGWEVPVTLTDCDAIEQRLRDHEASRLN